MPENNCNITHVPQPIPNSPMFSCARCGTLMTAARARRFQMTDEFKKPEAVELMPGVAIEHESKQGRKKDLLRFFRKDFCYFVYLKIGRKGAQYFVLSRIDKPARRGVSVNINADLVYELQKAVRSVRCLMADDAIADREATAYQFKIN